MPVVLEIAERVRELSTTRGSSTSRIRSASSRARCSTTSHRAIGLCNVAIGFQRRWARWLGVEPTRVVVDQVGLNHLTWVRRVLLDGDDVLPQLLADHGDELAASSSCRAACSTSSAWCRRTTSATSTRTTRCCASSSTACPRAQAVAEIERELLELYRDPSLVEKPALLEQRGGAFYSEAALGLVASLVSGDGAVHEVDVRNNGTLDGLAADDVVEVPARVTRAGAEPLQQAPLAPELLGLMQHVAAYERLALGRGTQSQTSSTSRRRCSRIR